MLLSMSFNSRSKDTDPVHTCGGRVTENASENQYEMVEITAAASSEDTGANLICCRFSFIFSSP